MIYRQADKTLAAEVQVGLKEKSHRPHQAAIVEEAKTQGVGLPSSKTQDHGLAAEVWSVPALARVLANASRPQAAPLLAAAGKSAIWRLLNDRNVKPQKIRYYLEKRDPDFDRKTKEVLVLYRDVSIHTQGAVQDACPNRATPSVWTRDLASRSSG